ncbi:MAG TPA: hypothetical protein VMM13_20790 [Euzebya sp.]|nr:hypothetical protein [Euzebya sp.]
MTLFLLLGILGTGMLILGLVGGELLDGLFDALGIDAGGGFFSTEVVGAFLSAFGFGAWLLSDGMGLATGLALAGGGTAGVVMGATALWLSRSLINMRTDATPTSADLRGALGRVISPIPTGGLGEVRVSRHGHPLKLAARAEGPLPVGVEVVVIDVISSTSVLVAAAEIDVFAEQPDSAALGTDTSHPGASQPGPSEPASSQPGASQPGAPPPGGAQPAEPGPAAQGSGPEAEANGTTTPGA